MKALFFALAFAGCQSCAPQPEPKPPIVYQGDAAPAPVDAGQDSNACPTGDTCAAACCNQRRLGCVLGTPTAKGNTCETVCGQHDVLGHQLVWPKACLSTATTCEECQ